MKHLLLLLTFGFSTTLAPVSFAQNTVPVTIDSDPQGVQFSFEVPNSKFTVTGTTPARINDVPTGKAFVHFETLQNCLAPKPQSRSIGQDKPMHFFGRYNCGNSSSEPDIIIKDPVVPNKKISARVSPSQLEALPGATVNFTVAVHNDGAHVDTPVTVQFSYNADQLTPISVPRGGHQVRAGLIEWTVPSLRVNETWSLSVPMRISQHADASTITTRVTAKGLGLNTASASTHLGTPALPETGFGFDSIFVALTALSGVAYAWRRRLV